MRNFAYNFEIFEEKESRKSGKIINLPSREQRLKIKKQQKILFWIKLIVSVLIVSSAITSFVFGQAVVAEYTHKISVYSSELEDIQSRNNQLKMHLIYQNFGKSANHKENISAQRVEVIKINSGDISKTH